MATLVARNPDVFKGRMETATLLITNGASWKAGQFLKAGTDTGLEAIATNHTAGSGGPIYYALTDQNDPGNTTTTAKVAVVTPDIVFIGNELDTTAVQADIGSDVAIAVNSNLCTIDLSNGASYPFAKLIDVMSEKDPRYTASDTLARLLFKVLTEVIEDDDT